MLSGGAGPYLHLDVRAPVRAGVCFLGTRAGMSIEGGALGLWLQQLELVTYVSRRPRGLLTQKATCCPGVLVSVGRA